MAYVGTYYAIGGAWVFTLANYFISGWFVGYVDKFYIGSFQIYVSIVAVFTILGNIALAVLRYRISEKALLASRKSTHTLSHTCLTFPSKQIQTANDPHP
jgi:hypothetical protein